MKLPTLRVRHLWVVPALTIAFYASGQAELHGLGLLPLLVFSILPHLPVLVSYVQPHARGQMAPRAVPLYNAMHHPVPPLAVLAVAAAGLLSPFWFVSALAWLSHIVIDWAMGDGLRSADGHRAARADWSDGPIQGIPKLVQGSTSRGRS
jgi:hypothetical protein